MEVPVQGQDGLLMIRACGYYQASGGSDMYQADTYLVTVVVSYTEEKDRCQERLWPGNLVLAGWRDGV